VPLLWRVSDPGIPAAAPRLRRFVHALGSAYGVLGATTLFILASVPLALRHLSREEFGLWALMTQIGGYLMLVDLGMSSAVARLLIDCKDRPQDGEYGGLIRTSWLVCLAQAGIVLAAGPLLAPLAAAALDIKPGLRDDFIVLMEWQCVLIGAGFALKPLQLILHAHQRMDVTNYAQIAGWAVNYAVTWWAFAAGWGVFSLLWGSAAAWVLNHLTAGVAVRRLRLFPQAGGWGRPGWGRFREVFAFAKDVFLIVLGTQLVDASQLLVITRALGLEAAAFWAVGTKGYQFLLQVQGRLFAMSAPAFAEMIVRGERERLLRRFRGLSIAAVSFAAFGGAGLILCNNAFVSLWTDGRMMWPVMNDVLLALCVVAHALKNFHASFIPLTKQVGALKWVYSAEGLAFIVLGLMLAPHGGLTLVIALSLACTLAFTLAYGVWRSRQYFGVPTGEMLGGWLKPPARVCVCLGTVAVLVLGAGWSQPPLTQLLTGLVVGTGAGGWCFARFGLPADLKDELAARLPAQLAGPFRRFSGANVSTASGRGA